MFCEFRNQILALEGQYIANNQATNTTPDTETAKSSIKKISKSKKYASDVEALKSFVEDFKSGLCIEISLQEILEIAPRKRRRTESYQGLISFMRKEFDIELTIKSRRTK